MTIEDLIKHHADGAATCKAFADTPAAKDQKTKDIAKHYEKRAKWHQEAVELLEGMRAAQVPRTSFSLDDAAFNRLTQELEANPMSSNDALKALLSRKPAWSKAVQFQRVPAGEEPDPDKWETLGYAKIEPIPASDL